LILRVIVGLDGLDHTFKALGVSLFPGLSDYSLVRISHGRMGCRSLTLPRTWSGRIGRQRTKMGLLGLPEP
jgi:hypothetical protein